MRTTQTDFGACNGRQGGNPMTTREEALCWPEKKDLLGVPISATTYHEAVEAIIAAAQERRPALVSAYAVHAVVTAARDPELKAKAQEFDIIVPDGQPVRWALNLLYRVGLPSNVRGTTLTWKLCERAARWAGSISSLLCRNSAAINSSPAACPRSGSS
jgi:UDP-N-acetyl-D-mannosaminuronic acid transferase (WecB/TagA/CpsF family)